MSDTNLIIEKNDGTESFTLKAESVKSTVSVGVVTQSLLGGLQSATNALGISGADPTLAKETYEINGVVKDADPEDYPNSGTYDNDDLGMTEEMKRAAKTWLPTTQDGLNVLYYDEGANLRGSIDGLLTEVAVQENRGSDGPRQYTFTMEWTHYDVYVG